MCVWLHSKHKIARNTARGKALQGAPLPLHRTLDPQDRPLHRRPLCLARYPPRVVAQQRHQRQLHQLQLLLPCSHHQTQKQSRQEERGRQQSRQQRIVRHQWMHAGRKPTAGSCNRSQSLVVPCAAAAPQLHRPAPLCSWASLRGHGYWARTADRHARAERAGPRWNKARCPRERRCRAAPCCSARHFSSLQFAPWGVQRLRGAGGAGGAGGVDT